VFAGSDTDYSMPVMYQLKVKKYCF